MRKVDECRDRLLGQARFGTEFSHYAALTAFEEAVRSETEDKVWSLVESVLKHKYVSGIRGSEDVKKFRVTMWGNISLKNSDGLKLRKVILSAAKELGIEVDNE